MTCSGSYGGYSPDTESGRTWLELRVDVDRQTALSPELATVSGDLFAVPAGSSRSLTGPGAESWHAKSVLTVMSGTDILITGFVALRNRTHKLKVVIPHAGGRAAVTLTPNGGGAPLTFSCCYQSPSFRTVELDVVICDSIEKQRLPAYELASVPPHPANLVGRTMTHEVAYAEAGIELKTNATTIDDRLDTHKVWTNRELHNELQHYYGAVPLSHQWRIWGLIAGGAHQFGCAGLMFDDEQPDRQGFAVFQGYRWFQDLPQPEASLDPAKRIALRNYLFTWVHEIGHTFNRVHQWTRRRADDDLSWMNSPLQPVQGGFWENFRFRFDRQELWQLRHGNRNAVIMGGDDWTDDGVLGGHRSGDLDALTLEGDDQRDRPLDVMLRCRDSFMQMEPVTLEVRLRNPGPGSVEVALDIEPEDHRLTILIQRPTGGIVTYVPLTCRFGVMRTMTLGAPTTPETGDDRVSQSLRLLFGRHGFYFSETGEYRIRAIYRDLNGRRILSNTERFRVEPLLTDAADLAARFFHRDVGVALYLGGSPAPYLAAAMDVIADVVRRFPHTTLSAELTGWIASNTARPFVVIKDGALSLSKGEMRQRAVTDTDDALRVFEQAGDRMLNLAHSRLSYQRASYLEQDGQFGRASAELQSLHDTLIGVKPAVLSAVGRERDRLAALAGR